MVTVVWLWSWRRWCWSRACVCTHAWAVCVREQLANGGVGGGVGGGGYSFSPRSGKTPAQPGSCSNPWFMSEI